MTGSSSKLLQIQGKWYRERKPKNKNPKPAKQKVPKLFVTTCFFLVKKRPFLSAVSPEAMIKIVMHAKSGAPLEVMGLMQGKVTADRAPWSEIHQGRFFRGG